MRYNKTIEKMIEEIKEAKEQEVKNEIYFLYFEQEKKHFEKMSYNKFLDLTILLNVNAGLKVTKENKERNLDVLVKKHNKEKAEKLENQKKVLNELLSDIKNTIFKTDKLLRENPFLGISYSERRKLENKLKELKTSAELHAITISLKDELTNYEFCKRKKDLKTVNNYLRNEYNKLQNPAKVF